MPTVRIASTSKSVVGLQNPESAPKDRVVRKVVRCIIEQWGNGDGATAKKRIDAKYLWGAIWWKDTAAKWKKIAQWDASTQNMELLGDGKQLQSDFDALMK